MLGLVPLESARAVANAYRDYRSEQHALRLQGLEKTRVLPETYRMQREAVKVLWREVFGS
jgi:glutamate-ammonia-ligase adenylyltransferase